MKGKVSLAREELRQLARRYIFEAAVGILALSGIVNIMIGLVRPHIGAIILGFVTVVVSSLLIGSYRRKGEKVRVCFRSRLTGFSGYGEPMSKELATAWLDWAKRQWPQLDHWLA